MFLTLELRMFKSYSCKIWVSEDEDDKYIKLYKKENSTKLRHGKKLGIPAFPRGQSSLITCGLFLFFLLFWFRILTCYCEYYVESILLLEFHNRRIKWSFYRAFYYSLSCRHCICKAYSPYPLGGSLYVDWGN